MQDLVAQHLHNKGYTCSSAQRWPTKALRSLHVGNDTLQPLSDPVFASDSQVPTEAGYLSVAKHCTETLCQVALCLCPLGNGVKDRQLPFPAESGGLCIRLAGVSTRSGQYSTNQERRVPARTECGQFAQGDLVQNNVLGHRLSQVFQKLWAVGPRGPPWLFWMISRAYLGKVEQARNRLRCDLLT